MDTQKSTEFGKFWIGVRAWETLICGNPLKNTYYTVNLKNVTSFFISLTHQTFYDHVHDNKLFCLILSILLCSVSHAKPHKSIFNDFMHCRIRTRPRKTTRVLKWSVKSVTSCLAVLSIAGHNVMRGKSVRGVAWSYLYLSCDAL